MFTGIIEEIGHVNNVKKGTASAILTIQAEKVLEGTHIGDSIAVNGVCLTVTGIYDNTFTADVMHETLNRSSLGKLGLAGTGSDVWRRCGNRESSGGKSADRPPAGGVYLYGRANGGHYGNREKGRSGYAL